MWMLAASLLMATVALLRFAGSSSAPTSFGDLGTNDFIEYWSAFRVAAEGGNPYDPAQLAPIQQGAGRASDVPLMMWNPPWLLLLMRPAMLEGFGQSASTWMRMNIVLFALSMVLVTIGCRGKHFRASDLMVALIGGVVSVPMLLTLQIGQIGLLLLCSVSLLYWALRRERNAVAGVALGLMSVKPHLFLLVGLLVVVIVARERRWGIVFGAAATMAGLCVATALWSQNLLPDWYQSVVSPPAGVPAAVEWKTPNLSNVVRALVARWTGTRPSWPMTVVPALSGVVAAWWLWRSPRRQGRRLGNLLPPVLCASVLTAPFGWTFDHVVLSLPQVVIFLQAFTAGVPPVNRWGAIGAVLLCQFGLALQLATTQSDYSAYWWFPAAMLVAWIALSRLLSLGTDAVA